MQIDNFDLITFLTVLTTLIVTLWSNKVGIKLQYREAEKTDINSEKREHIRIQLSDFYDPIYTLAATNRKIFEQVGPRSELRHSLSYSDDEIAKLWHQMVEDVILPNNKSISSIITSKLYLLDEGDSPELYIDFLLHAHTYRAFRQKPFSAYSRFQYPDQFDKNVNDHRNQLKQAFVSTLQGGINL